MRSRTTSPWLRALRRRSAAAFVALVVLLGPACGDCGGPQRADSRPQSAGARLEARLRSLLEAAVAQGLPGVSLRVTGPGIDFRGAAGLADPATGEPLSADHTLYVASLGKTFTATVVLQLCQEGRLDLDAPLTAWLSEATTARLPSAGALTLRHLLGHRSGLADYLNDGRDWREAFAEDPRRRWTNGDVLPYILDRPLRFEPGTAFDYSNSNYVLAGVIVERVTGRPLHALIRERILQPLGLRHSFHGHEPPPTDKRARGRVRWRGRVIDTFPWYDDHGLADAGMHSTPGDLARFLRALLTTDELLGGDMRREMTSVPLPGRAPSGYGLGILVHRDLAGGGPAYSHDGRDPGYEADMLHFAGPGLTIAACANASLGRASRVYDRLITRVVHASLAAVDARH